MESIELDKNGGLLPENSAELARAKRVDLITLPPEFAGTSCVSCLYIRNVRKVDGLKIGFCAHKAVRQPVSERQCCAVYDVKGAIRPWEQ